MRIDVLFPVELADDEVEILVLLLRHVFHQQRPGHVAAFDDDLEHAEHVAAPLRLVGAERAGGVQHAGRNQPAGAALQAIGPREIENAVVAFVPVLQALADLVFGRARLQAHERVGRSCCRRCCTAAGSSSSPACLPGRRAWRAPGFGACGAESAPCCRRISNRRASGCTSRTSPCRSSRAPASATASRSVKRLPSKAHVAQALRRHTRPSLAASVVLANQRSSMPPRFAP